MCTLFCLHQLRLTKATNNAGKNVRIGARSTLLAEPYATPEPLTFTLDASTLNAGCMTKCPFGPTPCDMRSEGRIPCVTYRIAIQTVSDSVLPGQVCTKLGFRDGHSCVVPGSCSGSCAMLPAHRSSGTAALLSWVQQYTLPHCDASSAAGGCLCRLSGRT